MKMMANSKWRTPILFLCTLILCHLTDGLVSLSYSQASRINGQLSKFYSQSSWRCDDWVIDGDESGVNSIDLYKYEQDVPNDAKPNISQQIESNRQSKTDNNEDLRTYFATCIPGLHNTLSSELVSLGATNVEPSGISGVSFRGSPAIGLKSILWCRTAHKIMELLVSSSDSSAGHGYDDYDYGFFEGIRDRHDLYQFTKNAIHTPSLLGDGKGGLATLSVGTIYTSRAPKEICHSHFTALTVKNALVDSVRELREDGSRPDVDVVEADVPLVVVVKGRRLEMGRRRRGGHRGGNSNYLEFNEEEDLVADVDIYRCLHAGRSLHRRGYRSEGFNLQDDTDDDEWGTRSKRNKHEEPASNAPIHRAAMKESLAAGLLLEAGWDKLIAAAKSDGLGAVLIDPMTGSATFPTEAALIACEMAPGLSRIASHGSRGGRNPHRFPPAVRWKDFCDESVWNELLADAARRAKSGVEWAINNNVVILCNEKNPGAISLAKNSIENSGVGSIISLCEGDCGDWYLGGDVIEGRTIFVCNPPWGVRLTDDIDDSWVSLREFLRREGNGAEAWVLSGNKDLTKILRMKKSRSVVVRTADEDLRWLQYHIFQKKDVPV
jgi:putative N6-adenine-specific DNA methylase